MRRALFALLLAACGNKTPTTAIDLGARCEQLAKACADNDKHIEKLVTGCKYAAEAQAAKGCTDAALAAYNCYQQDLCGKADKIWSIEDFRVLADRNTKCVAQKEALTACMAK